MAEPDANVIHYEKCKIITNTNQRVGQMEGERKYISSPFIARNQ